MSANKHLFHPRVDFDPDGYSMELCPFEMTRKDKKSACFFDARTLCQFNYDKPAPTKCRLKEGPITVQFQTIEEKVCLPNKK